MKSSKRPAGIRCFHTFQAAASIAIGVAFFGCGMRTSMPTYDDDAGTGGYAINPTGGAKTGGFAAGGGARTGGFVYTGGTRTGGFVYTGGIRTGGYVYTGGIRTGGYVYTGGIRTGGYVYTGGIRTGGYVYTGGIRTGGYVYTGGIRTGGYNPGTGGFTPTGGTPGLTCNNATNVLPCGGDVTGVWNVSPGCLQVAGSLNLASLGLGCPAAKVIGVLQVSGSFSVTSAGKFEDYTLTSGEEILSLDPKCLEVSGSRVTCDKLAPTLRSLLGFDALGCVDDPVGGCTCTGKVYQKGSMGWQTNDPVISGLLKTSKEFFTTGTDSLTGGDIAYTYCSDGYKMGVSPRKNLPQTIGTITLTKVGTIGTGGVIATGGVRTGGVPGSGGITTGGTTCVTYPNDDIIDDFSDGDGFIPMVDGRQGAWKTAVDSSPSAMISPSPSSLFTPINSDDRCRGYAAYIKGTGAVLWGSSVSCGLGSPYNASVYYGISFWAKSALGPLDIRVSLPNRDTHPDGGICQTSVTGCYNHFGTYVTLTTDWKRYELPFTTMRQEPGWGEKDQFDASTVYQVLWSLSQGKEYAFWLDHLTLTKGLQLLH